MTVTEYISERDELNIKFKECETPYCVELSGGITIEFDQEDNLSNIVLPNFFQMIHKQPTQNINIEYDHAFFEDHILTLVLKMQQQSINVKIDLSAIDK